MYGLFVWASHLHCFVASGLEVAPQTTYFLVLSWFQWLLALALGPLFAVTDVS